MEESFWSNKYKKGKTGWNIGYVSTPIKEYIDQLENKDLKILIPGSGNSYEAEYLYKNGFHNVFVADFSKYPLENFQKRFPAFPKNQLLHLDFFKIQQKFDLILEQTFFCALSPDLRNKYVDKMTELLNEKGKLVGVLFDFPFQEKAGPPFGGSKKEYEKLFADKFTIEIMETAYNSIKPRKGNELFIKMIKKTK